MRSIPPRQIANANVGAGFFEMNHPVETIERVMAAYQAGEPLKVLAWRCGVGLDTVQRWRRQTHIAPRGQVLVIDRDRLRALHAEGLDDREIARRMGHGRNAIWRTRTALELPANAKPHFQPGNRHGVCLPRMDTALLRSLHAAGLTDEEVGLRMGKSRQNAGLWRNRLGLPLNGRKA